MIFYFQDKVTKEKFFNRNHIFSTNYLAGVENNTLLVKYPGIFNRIDWSREPIESLETLFAQRAHQLRERSYLILYFSGGSDSTTILKIFLNNNIPIDELVINRFSEINDIRHNGTVALEYLKSIDYKGKVTIVDITYDVFKKFFNKQLAFFDGYFPGFLHSILRMRIDFFEQNDLKKAASTRPTNAAHIFGEASPIIQVRDKKYYSQLIGIRNMGSTTYHQNNTHFFTSEKFPQLHIKQSHIIANYFKEHFPEETSIIESDKKYTHIFKKLLRYSWDTRADFKEKSTGMPGMLKNNEASIILDFYKTKSDRFIDDYNSSYLNEYKNSKLFLKTNNIWPVLTPGLGIPKYYLS